METAIAFQQPVRVTQSFKMHRRGVPLAPPAPPVGGILSAVRCGAASLRDVMKVTRATKGGIPGFFGVLHTWGRNPVNYHPHVHFVVPGGAVKTDASGHAIGWLPASENFLVHHPTLIRTFRAKFRDRLADCGVTNDVPRRRLG